MFLPLIHSLNTNSLGTDHVLAPSSGDSHSKEGGRPGRDMLGSWQGPLHGESLLGSRVYQSRGSRGESMDPVGVKCKLWLAGSGPELLTPGERHRGTGGLAADSSRAVCRSEGRQEQGRAGDRRQRAWLEAAPPILHSACAGGPPFPSGDPQVDSRVKAAAARGRATVVCTGLWEEGSTRACELREFLGAQSPRLWSSG